jgi:hypothetical protein
MPTPEDYYVIAGLIAQFESVCNDALCDNAAAFTCTEAEAIADLLNLAGPGYADGFLIAHARGDSEDEGDNPAHLELRRKILDS